MPSVCDECREWTDGRDMAFSPTGRRLCTTCYDALVYYDKTIKRERDTSVPKKNTPELPKDYQLAYTRNKGQSLIIVDNSGNGYGYYFEGELTKEDDSLERLIGWSECFESMTKNQYDAALGTFK